MKVATLIQLYRVSLIAVLALALSMATSNPALARYGDRSEFTPIVGQGTGHMVIAPQASNDGTFAAEMTIVLRDTAPDTTFAVQRVRDLVPDGICTNTNFTQYEQETVTTSKHGHGTTHIHYVAPFPSGQTFDVWFRVVGIEGPGTGTILRTGCMTITVK